MINYNKNELYKIAKRENNTKRPYLLVNPLQGKHMPVSPAKSFEVFKELSDKLSLKYEGEKLLIIGFAETATAIGAAVAVNISDCKYFIQTTREIITNARYLIFSETHSHATEQKLVSNNLHKMIEETDRIVFIEDEVTTGNTILSIINIIKDRYYTLPTKFGIGSILNSMTTDTLNKFSTAGIDCTYILKLGDEDYTSIANGYSSNNNLCRKTDFELDDNVQIMVNNYLNSRVGVDTLSYKKLCSKLSESVNSYIDCNELEGKDILVLGTEEFMYPAMYSARIIEKTFSAKSVSFHATTRSPIMPCSENGYPIVSRNELASIYDKNRVTYLYNLKKYDKAIVIHDSDYPNFGLCSLKATLNEYGCSDITIFKWGE